MRNIDETDARVRNVMNSMPKSVLNRRGEKVRNTMKQTFSGMKTLLGQLAQGNTNKIREEQRLRKRKTLIIVSAVILVLIITTVVVIAL
ncbi:MAG: hypothetical protein GY750_03080 [Lentisphaerae bacterium]|nr:hypothetical protein [Lentisphaerota bacterium]MCP4100401.1 hypothetical protein [Lentisphaerota bacterium]